MYKTDPTDTKPCPHMRIWVSALSDKTLTGFARWYTERHIAGCTQCQKGLATILAMRTRLRDLHESGDDVSLASERWASVETAWEQTDVTRSHTAP